MRPDFFEELLAVPQKLNKNGAMKIEIKFTWRNLGILLFLFILPNLVLAEHVDLVLIEKAERRLTLMNGEKKIAEYSVALGGSPVGPKRCQGDSKTPEGTYKIQSRNDKSSYHRSLKVSYPNETDRLNAKNLGCSPGGDIMIHGLPNGKGFIGAAHRLHDWTLGCIAVTDSEIEEIWRLVTNGTVVKIVP